MKVTSTFFAMACTILPALMVSPASAADFVVGNGDGVCPGGYRALTYLEANANRQVVCGALNQWAIARLAGGGSMGGNGYQCKTFPADTRSLGHTVCTKGTPPQWEMGIDRPGGDITQIAVPDAASCEAACVKDQACTSWTYANGACWPKRGAPAKHSKAKHVSGLVKR